MAIIMDNIRLLVSGSPKNIQAKTIMNMVEVWFNILDIEAVVIDIPITHMAIPK